MNHAPLTLNYGPADRKSRFDALDALKLEIASTLAEGSPIAIDAAGISHIDSPLLQFLAVSARFAQRRDLAFCLHAPPMELLLALDRIGLDWRGLGITFEDSKET
jgi:anti-anti-sigma regulatory factor